MLDAENGSFPGCPSVDLSSSRLARPGTVHCAITVTRMLSNIPKLTSVTEWFDSFYVSYRID
jgi:hypothetical protein